MLQAIGVDDVDQLFGALADEHRLGRPLELPKPLSEMQLQDELGRRSAANLAVDCAPCFLGAGAYDHYIPTVVDDAAGRGEFVTAYTPYQAEASQGALQAFFEFQTQICRLTGLDVANASLYEAASAAAEAVHVALNISGKRRVLVAPTLHPHYLQVLRSDLADLPCELIELPASEGRVTADAVAKAIDDDTACVLVQSPNVFGLIEDWPALFDAAHAKPKTHAIALFNPIACELLQTPGECGADMAVGEGQPLGIPLQYGGPYVGLFAAKKTIMRKMPGRLVGRTVDAGGRPSYCLTLQTREQHIRGARATSNICTNQGLLALRATAYLSTMGPAGLAEVARQCYHKAHYAAGQIASLDGYALAHGQAEFFHEFLVDCPVPARQIIEQGYKRWMMPGLAADQLGIGDENQLLIAVTEKRPRQQIDQLIDLLKQVGES
jgi:glycine dehydrogenase subunit 1